MPSQQTSTQISGSIIISKPRNLSSNPNRQP